MSHIANYAITFQNRKAYKKILDSFSTEQINMIPAGYNNNIIWNCAHVITVQQMFTYGLAELPFTIPAEMFMEFSPGTKPVKYYDETNVDDIKKMLFSSMELLEADIKAEKFKSLRPFTTALKFEITNIESAIAFNQYHEAMHMGHVLDLRRFL